LGIFAGEHGAIRANSAQKMHFTRLKQSSKQKDNFTTEKEKPMQAKDLISGIQAE